MRCTDYSRNAVLALIALALIFVAGCGSSPAELSDAGPATGDQILPSSSAVAWVTYADVVADVTIVRDKRLAPTEDERRAGEGMIPRVATFYVNQVLWTRKGAPRQLEPQFDLAVAGWTFDANGEYPMVLEGAPRMDPRDRYVIPFAVTNSHVEEGPSEGDPAQWGPLGYDALIPYDGQLLGVGEVLPHVTEGVGTFRASMLGKTTANLVTVLNNTRIDSDAAAYMDKYPSERYWLASQKKANR